MSYILVSVRERDMIVFKKPGKIDSEYPEGAASKCMYIEKVTKI